MRQTTNATREIMSIASGMRDRHVSTILVSILKSNEWHSYWGLIKHFDRHPDGLKLYDLSRPYYTRSSPRWPATIRSTIHYCSTLAVLA